MSATYVMANDGLLYRDPVIAGSQPFDWFMTFDSTNPPELVMSSCGTNDRRAINDAEALLNRLGIQAEIVEGPYRAARSFGKRGPYKRAVAFYLDLQAPLPAAIIEGRGVVQPQGQCVIYSFGQTWG